MGFLSFARFIWCLLAVPVGAGLGRVRTGKAQAVWRELSWFAGPARCLRVLILLVSGSGAQAGESARNKTTCQVLGDLLRKSTSLLWLGAAASRRSPSHVLCHSSHAAGSCCGPSCRRVPVSVPASRGEGFSAAALARAGFPCRRCCGHR